MITTETSPGHLISDLVLVASKFVCYLYFVLSYMICFSVVKQEFFGGGSESMVQPSCDTATA